MCLDSGAYMANMKVCSNCDSNSLAVKGKISSDQEMVETVTYERNFMTSHHKTSAVSFSYYLIYSRRLLPVRPFNRNPQLHFLDWRQLSRILNGKYIIINYSFIIDRIISQWIQECMLCGSSEDSHSILPNDPRKVLEIDDFWSKSLYMPDAIFPHYIINARD